MKPHDKITAASALLAALEDTLAALRLAANTQQAAGDIVGSSETHGKIRNANAAIARAKEAGITANQ